MSRHLITINNVDFTGWVNRQTYKANHQEEGFTWKDVNLGTHRTVQRTRIKASMTMTFFSESDYQIFITALGNSGNHRVSLYVDSLGDEPETPITAAIKYTTRTVWTSPAYDERVGIQVVSLEISEL